MKIGQLILIILFVFSSNVFAGIRPSFSLDYSSWHATDIVIATEGEVVDGKFTVLETIKGGKLPFEQISIPELAEFKSHQSRQVKQWYSGKILEPPKFVTNSKMILFLKKDSTANEIWKTADAYDNFPTSVLWIEAEKSFAFIQTINPGDSILVEFGRKETEIRKRIFEIMKIEDSLKSVLKVEDKSQRAKALEKFAKSDFFFAREKAFEELKKCGKDALPVLLIMLADQSLLEIHREIIESLGVTSGQGVGDDLVKIIEVEFEFWKVTTPKLRKDWWNDINNPQTENYQNRYGKVLEAIYQLQNLKYKKSQKVVTQFRNFWRSQPKLNDKSGLDQMIEECDKLLKQFNKSF